MSIVQNRSVSVAEKIGKYTKYQREKRGYSLNQFAKVVGVTPSFLLRLEKGDYNSISFTFVEKIAQGFEMTLEDFLQKCEIIDSSASLPSLQYYLKEKYQFPEEAISDVKLFIRLLKVKYKKEIQELQKIHETYWKKNNKKKS